jgi:hypothetical protein
MGTHLKSVATGLVRHDPRLDGARKITRLVAGGQRRRRNHRSFEADPLAAEKSRYIGGLRGIKPRRPAGPKMVEPGGIEPPTSCMPCKRSPS